MNLPQAPHIGTLCCLLSVMRDTCWLTKCLHEFISSKMSILATFASPFFVILKKESNVSLNLNQINTHKEEGCPWFE